MYPVKDALNTPIRTGDLYDHWTLGNENPNLSLGISVPVGTIFSSSYGGKNSLTSSGDLNVVAGNNTATNKSGGTYVAYFFAHNNNDGIFGETGDQDIIKCGTYNGNGTSQEISVGFEPQWLLIKGKNQSSTNWFVFDFMRIWRRPTGQANDSYAHMFDVADAEAGQGRVFPTPDGFGFEQEGNVHFNSSSASYIYMAIRKPTKEPTAGTEVFSMDNVF